MIGIWKIALIQPIRPPIEGVVNLNITQIIEPVYLVFRAECPILGFPKQVYKDPEEYPWRYRCESCYYSSGDLEEIFRTSCDPIKNMKHEPTRAQQAEMSGHARQHQIMWAWARSLK